MDINDIYLLLQNLATKGGYNTTITTNDFNIHWASAERKYYNKQYGNENEYQPGNPIPRIAYPGTIKVSTSLSRFSSNPITITIDGNGQYVKPDDMYYVDSLSYTPDNIAPPVSIERIEKQELADRLVSYIQPPTALFPIYVEYSTFLQFYPITLAQATLSYLKKPIPGKWGFALPGGVGGTNLTGGTGYTDGTYPNTPLTGSFAGIGAVGTVTVVAGIVTSVTITTVGTGYLVGDLLTATGIGAGTGFQLQVTSLVNVRQLYSVDNSTQTTWMDADIDQIVYICLSDIAIFNRDPELAQFAQQKSTTGI